MTRVIAVMSVAVLVGCRSLEDPAASQKTRLVVHGVLDIQAGQQTVLVYRARTGVPSVIESGSFSDDEPVADADVTITGPDSVTVAAFRPGAPSGGCCAPGIYVFPSSPTGLVVTAGSSYTLRIRTPAGEEVTGRTTMPAPGQFVRDFPPIFFRVRDTVRLRWSTVPGAASYEVVIRLAHYGEVYRGFADSTFTLAGTALTIAGDEIFPQGEDAQILVSAVDSNYYDYYRSQSDPFAGAAPSHLNGAVGVFGSVAPILFVQLAVR